MPWLLLFTAAVVIAGLTIALAATQQRLRAAQAAAQRSQDELQQIAHAVSHELPEPLRAITGFTELLQQDYAEQLGETGQEFLEYIASSGHLMSGMLAGLLEYSRVRTLGEPFAPVETELVAKQAIDNWRQECQDDSIEVSLGDLPSVSGDAHQITRLFEHLLENASEFSNPENLQCIRISAKKLSSGMVEFRVQDQGIGVPAERAEEAFKLFRKLQPRDAYPGAGTGLAICRRIVRRHGGQIWIARSDTPGTLVCFTLPTV